MATHCFIPVLGKRIRVTQLDECGNPPAAAAADAMIATDGFITLSLSSEVEDGTEIITKKASGALCVNEKLADSFKRFTIEMEFCGVNPGLLSLTTNAEPYEDAAGDVAGFTVKEGVLTKKFALELWTGLSAQACAEGAEEASGYLLLPFVQAGVLGDISVDGENAVTFSLTGAYTRGGNSWGVGPYDVVFDDATPAVAGPLPTALDPLDHLLLMDTGVAPPPSSCDLQPMPALASAGAGAGGGSAAATGADAGSPGGFTPSGATAPADLTTLQGGSVTANPATAWTTGQSVSLADGSSAYWDGSAWVAGTAP